MKEKTGQLEELYAQIDSMAECLESLENQKKELEERIKLMEKVESDSKRAKFDTEVRL